MEKFLEISGGFARFALACALFMSFGCDEEESSGSVSLALSSPVGDDEITSAVTVEGTVAAGAVITLSVSTDAHDLGASEITVGGDGTFSVELEYTDQPIGTSLLVEAIVQDTDEDSGQAVVDCLQGQAGSTYATADEAPSYDSPEYSNLQIYDVANEVFLDDKALLEALDADQVVYFGEQHATEPIQDLQLWLLDLMATRHDNVALAMEHFQADEQPVIDDYLNDVITQGEFIADSDPWDGFQTYWLPLVDLMKVLERPVVATNIADEALQVIYGNGLSSPLAFFNSWGESSPFDDFIPPRPLESWDALYQDYFETGFDYATHGQDWGLTYQEALDYFTDLAVIRDHTMGYWIAQQVEETGERVFYVGGDWHVQTGIATPDIAADWTSAITDSSLITTTLSSGFASMAAAEFQGWAYADYILLYD